MNYYAFHIGDYASHTAHLTPLEDIAYRRMLDLYYRTQSALPDDVQQIARLIRMPENSDTVRDILSEFFKLDGGKYVNLRAEREIASFTKMKDGGKKGAETRWAKQKTQENIATPCPPYAQAIATPCPPHQNPNANQSHNQSQSHNQFIEAKASLSAGKLPDCPHKLIVELYGKHLPHLPQPRTWDGTRQQNLRARWAQCAKPSAFNDEGYSTMEAGIAFWDSFFSYIANDTKLSKGFESNGRTWQPDLPWMLKADNFAKIIDGKYDV